MNALMVLTAVGRCVWRFPAVVVVHARDPCLPTQVYTAKFPEATKAAETAMATASNASMA